MNDNQLMQSKRIEYLVSMCSKLNSELIYLKNFINEDVASIQNASLMLNIQNAHQLLIKDYNDLKHENYKMKEFIQQLLQQQNRSNDINLKLQQEVGIFFDIKQFFLNKTS